MQVSFHPRQEDVVILAKATDAHCCHPLAGGIHLFSTDEEVPVGGNVMDPRLRESVALMSMAFAFARMTIFYLWHRTDIASSMVFLISSTSV